MENDRRLKRMLLGMSTLTALLGLCGNQQTWLEGIPADARVVGIAHDLRINGVTLYVRSAEFPEVPEWQEIPELLVSLRVETKTPSAVPPVGAFAL